MKIRLECTVKPLEGNYCHTFLTLTANALYKLTGGRAHNTVHWDGKKCRPTTEDLPCNAFIRVDRAANFDQYR